MECPECHASFCIDCHCALDPRLYRCEKCLDTYEAQRRADLKALNEFVAPEGLPMTGGNKQRYAERFNKAVAADSDLEIGRAIAALTGACIDEISDEFIGPGGVVTPWLTACALARRYSGEIS